MAIKHRTQINVTVRWEKDRVRGELTYATLRWREPIPDSTKTRQREEGLGYLPPEEAERLRAEREAGLRLGHSQPASPSGYAVTDLLLDYAVAIGDSPTSGGHKDRVLGDCEAIGRHLGELLAAALTSHHVQRYIALRSREQVVRARQRKGEPDEDWRKRRKESRVDPEAGKLVAPRTIKNEIATLRRAMAWGRDAGKEVAAPVPLPHSKALPNRERPARRLTEGEARKLINAAARVDEHLAERRPKRWAKVERSRSAGGHDSLAEMLAWSGRRPIAIFALTVHDCRRLRDRSLTRELQLVQWTRDKGGEGLGWGPVTEPARLAILRRLDELGDVPHTARLWETPTGQPWTDENYPKVFRRIAILAEVEDVVAYDLRKHACSQILRQLGGVATDAIRYTGHKTTETLIRHYAYALEGGAESAAGRIGWTPSPLQVVGQSVGQGAGADGGDDESAG